MRKVYGRRDFAIIGELIEPRTRVLDLGCGEGELLAWLKENKQVDGRGVEMDRRTRAEGHLPAESRSIRAIWSRRWRIIRTRRSIT